MERKRKEEEAARLDKIERETRERIEREIREKLAIETKRIRSHRESFVYAKQLLS